MSESKVRKNMRHYAELMPVGKNPSWNDQCLDYTTKKKRTTSPGIWKNGPVSRGSQFDYTRRDSCLKSYDAIWRARTKLYCAMSRELRLGQLHDDLDWRKEYQGVERQQEQETLPTNQLRRPKKNIKQHNKTSYNTDASRSRLSRTRRSTRTTT